MEQDSHVLDMCIEAHVDTQCHDHVQARIDTSWLGPSVDAGLHGCNGVYVDLGLYGYDACPEIIADKNELGPTSLRNLANYER